MNLEALRTVRVLLPVILGLVAAVVNWNSHCQSHGSKGRQQSRELEGSASPTNLNLPELAEDEGLLEQAGDHEFFEDPYKGLNNKGQVSWYFFLKVIKYNKEKREASAVSRTISVCISTRASRFLCKGQYSFHSESSLAS